MEELQQHTGTLTRLGDGSEGTVFLSKDSQGNPIALKKAKDAQDLTHERVMLARVHEPEPLPGVPRLLGTTDDGSLIMEYVPGKTILELPWPTLLVAEILGMVTEVLTILAHIHRRGIAHNDLHEKNVLYSQDQHIFIVDFGWAESHAVGEIGPYRKDVRNVLRLISHYWANSFIERMPQAISNILHQWVADVHNTTSIASGEELLAAWSTVHARILPLLDEKEVGHD